MNREDAERLKHFQKQLFWTALVCTAAMIALIILAPSVTPDWLERFVAASFPFCSGAFWATHFALKMDGRLREFVVESLRRNDSIEDALMRMEKLSRKGQE